MDSLGTCDHTGRPRSFVSFGPGSVASFAGHAGRRAGRRNCINAQMTPPLMHGRFARALAQFDTAPQLPDARGDGQRNRRLLSFSFALLNISSTIRIDCAQDCAPDDCA
jgi:hypothetical protein